MKEAFSPYTLANTDRLSFTFLAAAIVHATIILYLPINFSELSDSAPSVSITMATHQSESEPEDADFIAQANQTGSGTLDEAKEITTDQFSPFNDAIVQETQLIEQTKQKQIEQQHSNVISSINNDDKTLLDEEKVEDKIEETHNDPEDIQTFTTEIASLQAKLDRQRQEYAKRPKERVLTSVSAKTSLDAAYLNDWTQKVEMIGNENFPEEAIRQQLTGSLRLQTIVRWDGSLVKAEILQSSGYSLLDTSALQIIRQAAPFSPFPHEIREGTDQLVIIRTWHFEIDGLSTSQ